MYLFKLFAKQKLKFYNYKEKAVDFSPKIVYTMFIRVYTMFIPCAKNWSD